MKSYRIYVSECTYVRMMILSIASSRDSRVITLIESNAVGIY